LFDVSSNDQASFSGGPLGDIEGILDKFGLDFNDLLTAFTTSYDAFKIDLLNGSSERQELFNLRPISLPRFPSLLQIGSKKPATQYSPELKQKLWDKLNVAFPSATFNGVKIPNIPIGATFATTFPDGDFPGEDVTPSFPILSFAKDLVLNIVLLRS
jgi:hypothetical protein